MDVRNLSARIGALPWALIVLAMPAAVAVWSGWVGLGGLTAFGVIHPLPGILDHATLNTAITLPIGVEAYAAYALRVWLGHGDGPRSTAFARMSALGSLTLGMLGQVAYHLMVAAHVTSAPWWITTLVACLPVAVLGMGAALVHLRRADRLDAERKAADDAAETERLRMETERTHEAEAAAEAARIVEAEAARAVAETEAGRLALAAAEAAAEKERLRAERLARQATGKPARKQPVSTPTARPETSPESAPDMRLRAQVKAAFLATVGTPEEWSNPRLASELYGVVEPTPKHVDAARVNARNWCQAAGLERVGKGTQEAAASDR